MQCHEGTATASGYKADGKLGPLANLISRMRKPATSSLNSLAGGT